MMSRRKVLQTLSAGIVVSFGGCLEAILHNDSDGTYVFVISNLTDEDLWFDIAVYGPNEEILLEDQFFLAEGKGYATDQFDDVAQSVDYKLSNGDSGQMLIPTDVGTSKSRSRRLFVDYTNENGLSLPPQ